MRAFMRLTGRIPVQVDEQVVPVVTAQYLGEPPWRTESVDALGFGVSPAVAARHAGVFVRMPAAASGALVLDQITLYNGEATAQPFSLVVVSNIENEAAFANVTTVSRLLQAEHINLTPATAFERIPADTLVLDSSVAGLSVGFEFGRVVLPASTSLILPVRVTLRGKYTNNVAQSQGVGVFVRTANIATTASFRTQYHPQAPL
jgi:hypothetical protein